MATEKPRILITSGGTGGHIFPAIALAETLRNEHNCSIMFVGGKLSKNPYFEKENFPYQEIECAEVNFSLKTLFRSPLKIAKGVREALWVLNQFKPDLVVGFGSYYTLPVLIATKMLGIPLILHEANSIPGKVNRLFAPFAEKTFVHFPCTQTLLRGKSVVAGMPLRKNFQKALISQEEAKKAFQLDPTCPTLLVFGGSQGAKRINELFSSAAVFHLKPMLPSFQVLHFTGNHSESELLMGRYVSGNVAAYVRPFEKRMDLAWAAADLAVTRAGASSIAEQIEYEVPGILIPYPAAADKHQDKNADFLEESGLIVKLSEIDLTPQALAAKIQEVFVEADTRTAEFKKYKKKVFDHPLPTQIMQWLQNKN